MENYILLYGDKKKEDNICIKNMFTEKSYTKLFRTTYRKKTSKANVFEAVLQPSYEPLVFD